jgi:hypothetical protein
MLMEKHHDEMQALTVAKDKELASERKERSRQERDAV